MRIKSLAAGFGFFSLLLFLLSVPLFHSYNYRRSFPSVPYFHSAVPVLPSYKPAPTPRSRLLKQPDHPGSLGESIRIHQPLIICPPHASIPHAPLHCSDYSRRRVIESPKCISYLHLQDFNPTPLGYTNLTFVARPDQCSNTSVIFMRLHHRDTNVCHILMRMLLGWHVLRNPARYNIPPVSMLVLISPWSVVKRTVTPKRDEDNFHIGLLKRLFAQERVSIVTVRRFEQLRSFCVHTGVILASFANRFAFPDIELETGERKGLSTDALAFRAQMFGKPPKMQRKLVYVARGQGRRLVFRLERERKFTLESERRFRKMLRKVANDTGVSLAIFEGDRSWKMSFEEQVAYFGDAAVAVGMHGAGLALGTFMPRGAAMIEIKPRDHSVSLFDSLQSFGLKYRYVRVRGKADGCVLEEDDLEKLESVLTEVVQEVVHNTTLNNR